MLNIFPRRALSAGRFVGLGARRPDTPQLCMLSHAARTVSCPYEVDAALLGQREHQKSGYLTTDRHGEILPVIEQVGHW